VVTVVAAAAAVPVTPGAASAVPAAVPAAAQPVCGPSFADPLPDTPWPLRQLRPDLVYPLTRGAGVTVAVIDSGVSAHHPALENQVSPGRDFLDPRSDGRCDQYGHGTVVAGIIAGRLTAASGFHGIAPAAKILPIRVLRDERESFDPDDPNRIAEAIRWAADQGVKVINLSLATIQTPALDAAVQHAVARDVVLVAAAGNQGQEDSPYPAAYPEVIAVAGVDESGARVSTSNTGAYVDIAAPGADIQGPAPTGGGYVTAPGGGTSYAAAYVSGVVALIRAYRTDLDAPAVVRRVLRTADRPAGGWDPELGNGVVNPYWAMASIPGTAPASPPAAALTPPDPRADSLRTVRLAAAWIGVAGAVGAMLVLLAVPVIRRGRGRDWRPGRGAPA
jgi:type VII secretion-associated serine protease mycosin